ncbi:BA75_04433T0 [Komagataella pastoris]|uniref:rRNA-processing protein FYV7 n=1 Tax=Komagataella pastoris TaxID=4922 RepID=A0A1B2JHC3_PICPA|nr:BA75_04433T0 [Komagataella pastoris]
MSGRVKSSDWRDLRKKKSEDIKRSLVHRARLRKKYFKILQQDVEQAGTTSTTNNEVNVNDPDADKVQEERQEHRDSLHNNNLKHPDRLSYQERLKMAKERKEQRRIEKIKQTKIQLYQIKQKKLSRESRKELFSKRTRTGQPMMGPRISNLLETIKNDRKVE